ncbi:MAG: hypothetical protein K9H84_00385 [Bacteroidales bacterium]|nr:hypothetical protein [Bacteroidales bacterium]
MKPAKLFLLAIFILITQTIVCQDEHTALSIHKPEQIKPTYFDISFGGSYVTFRDFATSPLFYYGIAGDFGFYRFVLSNRRESRQGFMIGYGETATIDVAQSAIASLGYLNINHTNLFKLPLQLPEKWNVKGGAMLNLSGNFRQNNSFRNNSIGMEGIGTLFASLKIGRDVSRNKSKTLDAKFFKINFFPRKRKLYWQVNFALVNMTYRNGYAYMEHSSIQNDYNYFDEHEFRIFQGYRLSSSLDYLIYLKNSNAFKLSYIWDAYHTGNDYEKLEMAKHHIMFSFLFSLKEKVQKPNSQ